MGWSARSSSRTQADGSLVKPNGKVVGSKLAGQAFTCPRYFHTRPSATTPAYNPSAPRFANLGPNSMALQKAVEANRRGVLKLERPYNPGLTAKDLPVDMITTSASGIDPDISKANADLQAPRIAAVRHLSLVHRARPDRRSTPTAASWASSASPASTSSCSTSPWTGVH